MPIFLGHRTAELILDKHFDEPLQTVEDQSLDHCWSSQLDLSQLDLTPLTDIPLPFDVLVTNPNSLTKWSGVRCHLCSPNLPYASFLEITPDIYVSSPAFCLIQRARELTLAQTIALASRFCGNYALDKTEPSGIRQRQPLTTPEELLSYTNHCKGIKGVKRARRAASLAFPNSASPMETISMLVYCLPTRLYGLGLSTPAMNYEQTLSPKAKRLIGTDFIRIDLYWRQHRFGLEYQGRYSHTSDTDIANDIARQLAAKAMGIDLQMLTIEQLRNPYQRLAIAQTIATHTGEGLPATKHILGANQRLIEELLLPLGS
ncbi:MAG: hypothetical protein IKG11_01550 [Atopobiaceae bacterium]|nr:hypothetical protein [Atopobiaceae bacterium]